MRDRRHHRTRATPRRLPAVAGRAAVAAAIVGLMAVPTACGSDPGTATVGGAASPGALTVAAAFSPIEQILRAVGGDAVRIITVVPPGSEAHDYEPTPKQVTQIERADVLFALGKDFQPGVSQMIDVLPDSVRVVDLLDGLTLLPVTDPLAGTSGDVGESLSGGLDPHVWLDPANMARMASHVVEVLSEIDPANANRFRDAAAAFTADLQALSDEFTAGLRTCSSQVIVTGHRAFEYLARAFGLRQLPIAGISPEEEPSAKTLRAVAAAARDNGVTTIFFEENLPDDLARTVADEIGATTAVLDTFESLSSAQIEAGATYFTVMRQNLATLRAGLGCR